MFRMLWPFPTDPAIRRRVAGALVLAGLGCWTVSAADDQPAGEFCNTAEACYRAVLAQRATSATGGTLSDQNGSLSAQLSSIRNQFPESVWTWRATLLQGLLIRDRYPTQAAYMLQSAQSEFPLLDDYLRLWTGEALAKAGEPAWAARLFESILSLTDTRLTTRASFRAGEAWYQAGECEKAVPHLERALAANGQHQFAPSALLALADCQQRSARAADGEATLRQLWVRFPQTPEAKRAESQLMHGRAGEPWRPSPEEWLGRALVLASVSLHEEAVGAFQQFLALAPTHEQRGQVKLKMGVSLVRLKRYDQARSLFQELAAERNAEAGEAVVWLARIFLRQDDGERLKELAAGMTARGLANEQRMTVLMLLGAWHEDQAQDAQASLAYQRVVAQAEQSATKSEALWRIGWMHYRNGRFDEAAGTLLGLIDTKGEHFFVPQAMYWTAKSLEKRKQAGSAELYQRLCRHYPYTYYCQVARNRSVTADISDDGAGPPGIVQAPADSRFRAGVEADVRYQKALELKWVGSEQDAAKELAALSERYLRDRRVLAEISALLSEAGAHHQALRLVRQYFREGLERGSEPVLPSLWPVAYPTAYLPTIRQAAGQRVDPFLAAAIIREESQYDPSAVSRTGAIGLMQVMPATAHTLAKKQGWADVGRADLFQEGTNIRVGVGYLGDLLQQFSGDVVRAVASYNAGPQIVAAWIAKFGDREPDEFVEMIPYQETRHYVKRVLRSYHEYRRLGAASAAPAFP
jgi:soluble lytic murein transglycosylase